MQQHQAAYYQQQLMTSQQLAPTAAPRAFSYTGANPSTHGHLMGGHHGGHPHPVPAPSTRPVTVRSVKRRDKAKTEEKRINAAASSGGAASLMHSNPGPPKVNVRNTAEENAAVMV